MLWEEQFCPNKIVIYFVKNVTRYVHDRCKWNFSIWIENIFRIFLSFTIILAIPSSHHSVNFLVFNFLYPHRKEPSMLYFGWVYFLCLIVGTLHSRCFKEKVFFTSPTRTIQKTNDICYNKILKKCEI